MSLFGWTNMDKDTLYQVLTGRMIFALILSSTV